MRTNTFSVFVVVLDGRRIVEVKERGWGPYVRITRDGQVEWVWFPRGC
jgi:hypothetical protein